MNNEQQERHLKLERELKAAIQAAEQLESAHRNLSHVAIATGLDYKEQLIRMSQDHESLLDHIEELESDMDEII